MKNQSSLMTFLEKNSKSVINKPCSRLVLNLSGWECNTGHNFCSQHLKRFAGLYGEQLTHMEVSVLALPMRDVSERTFYEQLSKLKSLTVGTLHILDTKEGEEICFPESFKRLTRLKLRVKNFKNSVSYGRNLFGKLIKYCVNLEYISCPLPEVWDCEYDSNEHTALLDILLYVLEKSIHKKLRILDLQGHVPMCQDCVPTENFAPFVMEIATIHNIKLANVNAKTFCRDQLMALAPYIVSIEIPFPSEDHYNIEFPNVKKMGNREADYRDDKLALEGFQENITPKLFPRLRKLVFEETFGGMTKFSSILWNNFPDLEEVVVGSPHCKLEDATFLGLNPEKPAFLNLTSELDINTII